jgi:hypothetical protein
MFGNGNRAKALSYTAEPQTWTKTMRNVSCLVHFNLHLKYLPMRCLKRDGKPKVSSVNVACPDPPIPVHWFWLKLDQFQTLACKVKILRIL